MNFTVLNFILTQIGKRGCSLVTYSTVNPFPLVSWFGVQGCTMAESRLCRWAWDPAGGNSPLPRALICEMGHSPLVCGTAGCVLGVRETWGSMACACLKLVGAPLCYRI